MTVNTFFNTFEDVFGINFNAQPFTPADIPDLLLWCDPSDASTITEVADAVSSLADKSGKSNDLDQASGTAQPLTNTVIMNKLNALLFDGINDFLENTAPGITILTGDLTYFMVFKVNEVVTANDALFSVDSQRDFQVRAGSATEFLPEMTSANIGGTELFGPSNLVGLETLVTIRFSDGEQEAQLRLNGIQVDSSTYFGNLTTPQLLRVGTNSQEADFLEFEMGEFIIYNRDLTVAELEEVESYLSMKWVFFPAAIEGLFAHYDPSLSTSITEVANAVSQIDDLSGNGFDLVQPGGTAQPLTNTATMNGLNALQYDGSNDFMSGAVTGLSQDATVLMAFNAVTTSSIADSVFRLEGSGADFQTVSGVSSEFLSRYESTGLGGTDFNSTLNVIGLDTIISLRFSSVQSVVELRINGTLRGSSPFNGAFDSMNNILIAVDESTVQFSNMNMGEVVVYDSALSDADLARAEEYMKEKWIALFEPTQIADLLAWYDPEDATTITQSGGAVSQLATKQGTNHLVQATEADKPLTGTVDINGLNALQFDGDDDFMVSTTTFSLSANDVTAFMIMNVPSIPGIFTPPAALDFDGTNDFSLKISEIPFTTDLTTEVTNSGLGGSTLLGNTEIDNINVLVTVRISTADSTMDMKIIPESGPTTEAFTSYNGALSTTQTIRVGTDSNEAQFLAMSMGEIVIYDRDLTTGEVQVVQDYLLNKWRLV